MKIISWWKPAVDSLSKLFIISICVAIHSCLLGTVDTNGYIFTETEIVLSVCMGMFLYLDGIQMLPQV